MSKEQTIPPDMHEVRYQRPLPYILCISNAMMTIWQVLKENVLHPLI